MRMYEMAHNITTFPTSSDWVTAKEFEAILDITRKQTTLVQYEKNFTAGYGPVIKKHTYESLKSDKIFTIDTGNWKTKSSPPRVELEVNNMSSDGKICRERAILEFERRMMGNNTEEIFDNNTDNKLIINSRQQVALYLDPRLKQRIAVMDLDGWKEAKNISKRNIQSFILI